MSWKFVFTIIAMVLIEPKVSIENSRKYGEGTLGSCSYELQFVLFIKCKDLQNLGENVDAIIKKYQRSDGSDVVKMLVLEGPNFPNATMTPKWYNGQTEINDMSFVNCNLSVIEPGAFDLRAFRSTAELTFTTDTSLNLTTGMFNGFRNLKKLGILSSAPRVSDVDLFKPICKSLDRMQFNYLTDELSLNQIFGSIEMLALKSLSVIAPEGNNTRILAPNNFTALVAINSLILYRCRISSILSGTFDAIAATLLHIDLSFNRLTTIQASLLWAYLDTEHEGSKYFFITKNPFECDCDLYEIVTLSLSGWKFTHENCNFAELICEDLQEFHIKNSSIDKYAFRKVEFHVKNDVLVVKTRVTIKFRLLIFDLADYAIRRKSKCPRIEWVKESVRCLLLPKLINTLALANYLLPTTSTTFCAILASAPKTSWPLHCVTIRRGIEEGGGLLGICLGLIIWTFLLAISLIVYLICTKPGKLDPKPELMTRVVSQKDARTERLSDTIPKLSEDPIDHPIPDYLDVFEEENYDEISDQYECPINDAPI